MHSWGEGTGPLAADATARAKGGGGGGVGSGIGIESGFGDEAQSAALAEFLTRQNPCPASPLCLQGIQAARARRN